MLAREGDADGGTALALEAIDLAAGTADIELQADALLDLDEVLEIIGREQERGPHIREALALYERKGDIVMTGKPAADSIRPSGRPGPSSAGRRCHTCGR